MTIPIHEFHRRIRAEIHRAGDLLGNAHDDATGTPMAGRDAIAMAGALADIAERIADLCDQAVRNHALAGHTDTPEPGSPLTTGEHFRTAERRARETATALYRTAAGHTARAA